MTEYEFEWCTRESKTKWCNRMEKENGSWGIYLGTAGCYRPNDRTICMGRESAVNARMHNEEDETIRFLTDVLCHEEIHRAIHEVTNSARASLTFDRLFGYPFDFEVNREYFPIGEFCWSNKLTSYGEWWKRKHDTT